jgi:hypothetical protein
MADGRERLIKQLTAAGDSWPLLSLPHGARIAKLNDRDYRDQVIYRGRILYRAEESDSWYAVGWSDASKSQILRPRPMTEEEHFLSLHSDDDS